MNLRGNIKQLLAGNLCLLAALLLPNTTFADPQDHYSTSPQYRLLETYSSRSQHLAKSRYFIAGYNGDSGRKHSQQLTPQQRKQIKQRHRRFDALPPEEKTRIRKARQHFKELPAERRQELRRRWKNLSPDERHKKRGKMREQHGNNRYRASRA